jgi:hypothetical protein
MAAAGRRISGTRAASVKPASRAGKAKTIKSTGVKNSKAAVAKPTVTPIPRLGARVEYRIYPSIGIARVGDSRDGLVWGPEAPGIVPDAPYRGSDGGLRPQGARFRIYKVEIDANENEAVTAEITASNTTKIGWTVNLSNRKAAGPRIADTLARSANPGSRNDGYDRQKLVISAAGTITGVNKARKSLTGSIEFAKAGTPSHSVPNIELASLITDAAGRLVVIGGPGKSASPLNLAAPSFSDNDGWYDSVSDGPVRATLNIKGTTHTVVPAWVLVTVPRYAPGIYGIVTWYDQAVSMARTNDDGTFSAPRTTSFTRDIYPILKRADDLRWVHRPAHGTSPRALSNAARMQELQDSQARVRLVARLSAQNSAASGPEQLPPLTMPMLNSGANPDPSGPPWVYPSLTRYQHAHVRNWMLGNFDADWPGQEPVPVPFSQIDVAMQPRALCEAALETCVGGSFFPGIEGTYDVARAGTYHPQANLRREFRVDPSHPAGFLTEKMALPWQADFADCGAFWWPSQRPVFVNTGGGQSDSWDRKINGVARNGHLNMVDFWSKLGLIVRDPATGVFVETDRQSF